MNSKITIRANVYGGLWAKIEVSDEITTEVVLFTRINEGKINESLNKPKIVLFSSENITELIS